MFGNINSEFTAHLLFESIINGNIGNSHIDVIKEFQLNLINYLINDTTNDLKVEVYKNLITKIQKSLEINKVIGYIYYNIRIPKKKSFLSKNDILEANIKIKVLSKEVAELFEKLIWPGNVLQLHIVCQSVTLLS